MTATIEWSYNPWRDRPARAAAAALAALLSCLLVTSLGLPGFVAVVLCIAAVSAMAAAFVPVWCRLDDSGVVRRSGWFAERRPWTELRRAVRTSEGVLLSPFQSRHWLDAYRALFLPIPSRGERPLAADVDRVLTSHGL